MEVTQGGAMVDWIPIIVFYLVALGAFRFAGGLGSAADAFRRWGRASSGFRESPGSSS
jgi:hypothetical protein